MHVNQFDELRVWERRLMQVFGGEVLCEEREFVRWFESPKHALRSLKGVGANRVKSGARSGLTGKKKSLAMLREYERFRTEKGVPLTYRILKASITV